MAAADISDRAGLFPARPDLRLITDDNMLTEFKKISDSDAIGFLYKRYDPHAAWLAAWRKHAGSAG